MHVWDEAKSILSDTDTIGTINGVSSYMEKISFFIGVALGELILGHSDNLSKSLQSKVLTAAQGQHQAELTVKTLESLRNDASFILFLDAVLFKAEQCDVDPQCYHANEKGLSNMMKDQNLQNIKLLNICIKYLTLKH
uniref:Uncharacterized protein n=1 Tax=Amphimedon queenslandica TaxID=400682 RepID=A0A1X7UIB2_AMPQE